MKTYFLLIFYSDICAEDTSTILLVAEIANFLADVIKCFPTELDLNRWDFIRIALSSWSLSVSKSWQKFSSGKVSIFIAAVYRLFAALTQFIGVEKTKSSTENLTKMIEEWDNVFAKDVNLVLLKTYINMVSTSEGE
jgi:E3 ubiquitin-protein ligase listerin